MTTIQIKIITRVEKRLLVQPQKKHFICCSLTHFTYQTAASLASNFASNQPPWPLKP